MEDLANAKTIVVIADDLESSHNIAALRVKDAVVRNDARIVVVASRYGEVCDFIAPPPSGTIMPTPQKVHSAEVTGVWLRPTPGGETATVAGLAARSPRRCRRSLPTLTSSATCSSPASTALTSTAPRHPGRSRRF